MLPTLHAALRGASCLAAALLLAACGDDTGESTTPPADTEAGRLARARELTSALQSSLQTAWQEAMTEGGPAAAIDVCATRATVITNSVGGRDWSVRRIGTRVRNVATNRPTPAEEEILDEFAALPVEESKDAYRAVDLDGDDWNYYAPISIPGPLCLNCHGDPEDIPESVQKVLNREYPEDEATGYEVGDLRGAFVVEYRPPH